ncbi:MAG: hypothetical protein M5U34_46605 [Chloroflexi bacterium]|nr:hypothetical protein [Chloroflexota bacterium]
MARSYWSAAEGEGGMLCHKPAEGVISLQSPIHFITKSHAPTFRAISIIASNSASVGKKPVGLGGEVDDDELRLVCD